MDEMVVLLVFIVMMLGGMFGGIAYDSYNKSECRKNAIEHNYTSDQIQVICKGNF
jgi:hypothetical protein